MCSRVGMVLEGGSPGVFAVCDYFMKGLKFPYVVGVSAGAYNLLGYASSNWVYEKLHDSGRG